jgi:peptide/nickel transport system substrate-binding protein
MDHRSSARRLSWAAGASALVVLLASCGTTGESPGATGSQPGGESPPATGVEQVRAGMVGDEATLNPYTYVTGFPGWNLLMLQYDSLLQFDVGGEPQPWLASAYEVSDDGLTYTVDLVPDVTWNDGEPLTADDVKFTVDYFLANTHSRFTRDLSGVSGAEVTGDNQVVITLEAPNPAFPLRALADLPILPQHVWEAVENPAEATFGEITNVGSGPYKLVEYTANQSYRFEANADYFRGAPQVSELVLVQYADEAGLVAGLRAGEIDVTFRTISPEQVDVLGAVEGIEISQGPEFTTQMLYYDVTKAPFDQLPVRQAIALAIDRQDLVDTVYLGAATVGNMGWTHPQSPAFNDAVETRTDVDEANAILDDAAITDSDGDGIRELNGAPLSAELLAPSDNPLRLRMAELIREMLLQIGLDAQVTSIERETLVGRVWPDFDVANGRDYEMSMFGWSAPVQVDPSQITSLLHSDPAIGSINISGFSDPEADQVSEDLLVEQDEARRQELLDRLQEITAEQLPFVMLLYGDGAYAYQSGVYADWAFITGQGIVSKLSLLPAEARP